MPVSEETRISTDGLTCCPGCDRPMPLRLPKRGEASEPWECVGCGAMLSAVRVAGCPTPWYAHVRRPGWSTAVPPFNGPFPSRGTAREPRPTPGDVRSPIRTELTRALDRQIETGDVLRLPPQGNAFRDQLRMPVGKSYDPGMTTSLVGKYESAMNDVAREFQSLVKRGTSQLSVWRTMASDFLARYVEDRDLVVCLGVNPTSGEYPARHSLHTAVVAMAIGTTMGWDETTLVDLALGCFLHDAGMQLLDKVDVRNPHQFGQEELTAVAAHPIHTFDLLRYQLLDMPNTAKMVAYQMHERCNGSGYPMGRLADQIHPAAKVAAIADAFVALCSPRPFRPALVPYYAIVALLDNVRDGLFDPRVARALLRTVSLFPVGSNIALGESVIGRVLRTNPDRYDRPVVETWDRNDPSGRRAIIDLSEEPERWHPRPISGAA